MSSKPYIKKGYAAVIASLKLRRTTHGKSKTAEYKTWCRMKTRCNVVHPRYAKWNGRGIKVCARWDNFENFFEDMGLRPSPKHSLDRIDNDGDYCKENCRWATRREQNMNMSRSGWWFVIDNAYTTAAEAAKANNVTYGTIMHWCKGYSVAGQKYPPRNNCFFIPKYW